jgi:hypothetical protein
MKRRKRVLDAVSRRLRAFYNFLRMAYTSGAIELFMRAEQRVSNSDSRPDVP